MTDNPDLPMNRDKVMEYLPHRDPMLFIDRVVALKDGVITIESDICPDAPFFKGHFPGLPIMPGVLIVETVAQAGVLLVALTQGLPEGKFIAFTGIEETKFRQPVYPNETISVDVEIVRARGPFYKFSGIVRAGDKDVAGVKFSAAQMDFNQDS